MNLKAVITLLRPKQWTKNAVLFAALIFSKNLFQLSLFCKTLAAFCIFCLFSSCVYIINDVADRKQDQAHPQKKNRPLPSGKITPSFAIGLFFFLFLFATAAAFWLEPSFAFLGLLYFTLMAAYTFLFKKIVILDILTIAMGFVLRAVSGSVLIGVYFSSWLLLCTFLLAMFLALQKRRAELLYSSSAHSRKILEQYSPGFIHDMLNVVTSCTVMSYCLYTLTSDHSDLMITIPAVFYGVFRYQYLSGQGEGITETPELALLKDKPLLLAILIWVFLCVVILYR